MRYWLMKSEPDVYSLDDLRRDGETHWEGVRNYQARNSMRDDMKLGDLVLFYHSNASPPGVAGVAKVVREAYPDDTARDPKSDYFDPKETAEAPRWVRVDLGFVEAFPELLSLAELKAASEAGQPLQGVEVTRKGSRLSVQPVSEAHFQWILARGRG